MADNTETLVLDMIDIIISKKACICLNVINESITQWSGEHDVTLSLLLCVCMNQINKRLVLFAFRNGIAVVKRLDNSCSPRSGPLEGETATFHLENPNLIKLSVHIQVSSSVFTLRTCVGQLKPESDV